MRGLIQRYEMRMNLRQGLWGAIVGMVILVALLVWLPPGRSVSTPVPASRTPQPPIATPSAEVALNGATTSDIPTRVAEVPSGPKTTVPAAPTLERSQPKAPASPRYAILLTLVDSTTRAMDPQKTSLLVEDDKGARCSIDASGERFIADHLHEGGYHVSVHADGYGPQSADIHLSQVKPTVSRTLVMRSANSIKVKMLTDDGHDLAQRIFEDTNKRPAASEGTTIVRGNDFGTTAAVIAVATREKPGERLPETSQENHSRFAAGVYRGWGSRLTTPESAYRAENQDEPIPAGYAGILELFEPLPLHVSAVVRDIVIESKLVPDGAEEVVFNISVDRVRSCFGEVHLRIVDALSELPVKDCSVGLHDRNGYGRGFLIGANGEIVLENVRSGLNELQIIALDHEQLSEEIRIDPGRRTELGTYRLQPALGIQGVLVLPSGQPASAPKLSLLPLASFDPDRRNGASWSHLSYHAYNNKCWACFTTNSAGEFRAMSVGRGKYLLRLEASSDWALRPVVVDTTSGSVEDLRLQAEKGTAVTFRFDRDVDDDTWLRIFDSGDLPICDVEPSPFYGWAAGRASIRLASGAYRCAVFSKGSRLTTLPLEVGSSALNVVVPH